LYEENKEEKYNERLLFRVIIRISEVAGKEQIHLIAVKLYSMHVGVHKIVIHQYQPHFLHDFSA
jgi:hypothetical protein